MAAGACATSIGAALLAFLLRRWLDADGDGRFDKKEAGRAYNAAKQGFLKAAKQIQVGTSWARAMPALRRFPQSLYMY